MKLTNCLKVNKKTTCKNLINPLIGYTPPHILSPSSAIDKFYIHVCRCRGSRNQLKNGRNLRGKGIWQAFIGCFQAPATNINNLKAFKDIGGNFLQLPRMPLRRRQRQMQQHNASRRRRHNTHILPLWRRTRQSQFYLSNVDSCTGKWRKGHG